MRADTGFPFALSLSKHRPFFAVTRKKDGPSTSSGRTELGVLALILIVALALRLATLALPATHHPDEIYQYLEAAHRIVFGYGTVTWEYRVGMRGWLFPSLLTAPMWVGNALSPGGSLYLLLPRLAMVAASTTIVASAWTLGARASRTHAVFAALVAATWYEFVAFAAHPVGESAALAAAAGGAALLFGARTSPRRYVAAGALLALAGVLRFQYAPALAILWILAATTHWRARWLPLFAGAALTLAASAFADAAHGATPFAWLAENIRQNLILHRAAAFGESGPLAYLGVVGSMWGWATVPILIAAAAGARRQPALGWAALAHIVVHSLIAHKEYRFLLLSQGLTLILAGIGTAELLVHVAPRHRRAAAIAAALAWVATSATFAARWDHRPLWTARAAAMETFADIRSTSVCGVGILGLPISEFGGYAALNRPVPLVILDRRFPDQRRAARDLSGAFDTIVATGARAADVPAGYARIACRSTAGEYVGDYADPAAPAAIASVCLYRRPGGCDAAAQRHAAPLGINRALADSGM